MLTFDQQLCEETNNLMDLLAGVHGQASDEQLELIDAAISLLSSASFMRVWDAQPESVREQYHLHRKLAQNACELLRVYHGAVINPEHSPR